MLVRKQHLLRHARECYKLHECYKLQGVKTPYQECYELLEMALWLSRG